MILAIDDDADRYAYFVRLLDGKVDFKRACCPAKVAAYLPNATAVLLDYDLDQECHKHVGRKGIDEVDAIRRRGVPTIIVSANSRGAKLLYEQLTMPANTPGPMFQSPPLTRCRIFTAGFAGGAHPELIWLGQLWVWGCL